MVVASRIDTSLAATITQSSYVTALKTAFTNAGFSSPVDDYTSGTDRILTYQFDVDNTKLLGSNFLRVRVTSGLITYQQLYTSWNATTHTGNNANTEITYSTLSTANTIGFVSLNGGSEYKFIFVTQGTTFLPLGIIAPANRPDWWDLNNWSYGFIWTSASMAAIRTSGINPYNNADFDLLLNSTRMASINPQTNRRDILAGLVLLTQSNAGSGGRTSDDLAQICGSGSGRYDVLSVFGTTQQYLVINNASAGIAIRTQ